MDAQLVKRLLALLALILAVASVAGIGPSLVAFAVVALALAVVL